MTRLTGRSLFLILVLGAIWGTSFPIISVALNPADPHFSPILLAALRFDLAGAAVLAVAAWRARGAGSRERLLPQTGAQWRALAAAAAFNTALYHALLFLGQPLTNAAIAAVIVGLNPILTTALARGFLSNERLGSTGLVGLGLGFAGILALAALRGGSLLDPQGVGELLVFGAILAFAFGSILVRRAGHGMDVFAFTGWQMLGGALVLHVTAFALEEGGFARWNATGVLALLYLALAASAVGFLMYFTLLERVGPIRANLVSHVAPVFAAAVVWLSPLVGLVIPGPPLGWRALVAFALIASGFALIAREPTPAPVSPRQPARP